MRRKNFVRLPFNACRGGARGGADVSVRSVGGETAVPFSGGGRKGDADGVRADFGGRRGVLSLAQTLSSCLTALGKQRGAAACWGVACLSRILFDLVFAGVLKFSAKGAAAAESLCYFVAFFLILLYNKACMKGERIITEAKA